MKRRGQQRQPSARAEAARRRALPGRFGADLGTIDGQAVIAAAQEAGMPGHAAAFRAGAAKLVMIEDLDAALAAGPEGTTSAAGAPVSAAGASIVDAMLDGAVVAVDANALANLHARAAVGDNVEVDRAREGQRLKVSEADGSGAVVVAAGGYGSVGLPPGASLLTPAERATLDARRGRP